MKKYLFSTPSLFLLLLHCSAFDYMPKDDIAVNCGSSGNSTDQWSRSWTGDQNSKYSPIDDNSESSLSTTSIVPQWSDIDKVPYGSVRLSSSPFNYSFPVTVGPKFIRLHFYPFNYANLSRTDAYFSVTYGSYTLLRNFSAALTADYLNVAVFFREFCVNVGDNEKWLNLTFTPTTNQPNAYAFINGIEVVSMPVNLYYGDLKGLTTETTSHQVKFLGDDVRDPYNMSTTIALETMYRINVGGDDISPAYDSGMYRTWEGRDFDYLTEDPHSSVLPMNLTMQLYFTMVPTYTAPDYVYRTARSMGKNGTVNEAYNLTWSFQVDTNFYYLVRLHFCEIEQINNREDRNFQIFIATIMAEDKADVIRWTGSKYVPYFQDYIVDMFDHENKKVKLEIAIHPGVWGVDTRYADAILNGLEIFKISNDTGNLAGPNPPRTDSEPPSTPLEPSFSTPLEPSFSKSGNKTVTIASIVGGVVPGIVVISLLVVCALWLRRSKQKIIYLRGQQLKDKNEAPGMMNSSWKEQLKNGDGNELPIFDFGSILVATDKFSSNNRLGQGGFGPVYKGKLPDGKDVAVKRLCSNSGQGIEEFKNEITLISKLQHRNLVRLVGFCIEEEEKILIYEYLPNKSLDTFIFDPIKKMELNWDKRFQIIQGIARGLLYLHRDSNLRVIHRDLKASNILLDQNFNPKISDFGLARMFQGTIDIINTRKVAGTLGYMAPEYVIGGIFSEKSDVYSFGVLLLEVVSTKKNTSFRQDEGPLNLVSYTWELWREGRGLDLLDGAELESCCLAEVEKCIQIGLMCLQDQPADRPLMSSVIQMLSGEADLSLPKEPTFFTFQITSMMIEAPLRLSTAVVVSYSDIEGR